MTKTPRYKLIGSLDMEMLEGECTSLNIIYVSEEAEAYGWKSKICFSAPSNLFLEILNSYDLGRYVIVYLEVAKDVIKNTKNEATLESYRLIKSIKKKNTTAQSIADFRDSTDPTKLQSEKGLFSDMTGYLGSESLQMVLYARDSKITGEPCIHSEWCIRGARNIKRIADIYTVNDMIKLDVNATYEWLSRRYITVEEVNIEKLGKFIKSWERRRKFTRRQNISIGIAATTFLSIYSITSASQLANFFKIEKTRLKSKRGPKTEWEDKMLSVRSNGHFSDPIIIV